MDQHQHTQHHQQQPSWHDLWHNSGLLLALGVALTIAAQVWQFLPAITAIALIARGVVLILQSRPRSVRGDSLILVNLVVYCLLVCLAIIAQSNAVLQSTTPQIRLSMLLDHSTAIVILAGLMFRVFARFSQPTVE